MPDSIFDPNSLFQEGLALRKAVLGEDHVERSLAAAEQDPLFAPMQQLTTEIGWGKVWARPGLERKTRSFLSCAFLLAGGKHEELKTHIRGARNNGATREEIVELIVHGAIYCGFPSALEAARIAREVFAVEDAE